MRGLFTDSYSLFSARPVAALAASLRGRLTPPAGWGGWFFWSLTEPFRGSVTDDGFRLTSYYARTQTTVRGTFVPLARGTRIDVQVSAIGAATWVVLALVGIPLLGLALLGAGLLVAGQALGLFLLAPLLVIDHGPGRAAVEEAQVHGRRGGRSLGVPGRGTVGGPQAGQEHRQQRGGQQCAQHERLPSSGWEKWSARTGRCRGRGRPRETNARALHEFSTRAARAASAGPPAGAAEFLVVMK